MPDWCVNVMTIGRNASKVLDYIKGKDTLFDFNRVIPMPANQPDLSKPNPFIADAPINSAIRESFGKNNWYDWSYQNWGTKWNACDVTVDGNTVHFLTAWAAPIPVFLALSKQFPTTIFRVDVYPEIGRDYILKLKDGTMRTGKRRK